MIHCKQRLKEIEVRNFLIKKDRTLNHPLSDYAHFIIYKVASYFNLTPEDLTSKTKVTHILIARYYAISIISENTDFHDYTMVFFNRDRTTFYNAIDKISDFLITDKEKKTFDKLKSSCTLSNYVNHKMRDNKYYFQKRLVDNSL